MVEKDDRLWMRFPIGFDEDPAIEVLSDAAFRAFVSMNGYSRRNDLDGRLPARAAAKRWGEDVLAEIIDARPESPILALDGDVYVLTKYSKHQDTTEARAKRSAINSENGRKGGRPPKGKRTETESVSAAEANGKRTETETKAESESESESELDTPYLPEESLDPNARDFEPEEINGIRGELARLLGAFPDDLTAVTVATMLLEASPRPVSKIVGYVRRCVERSPMKVRGLCAEAERQAAAVRAAVEAVAS